MFVESAYPALADRRLEGKKVAALVVGSVDTTLDWVRRALARSGGDLVRMRALNVPVASEELEQHASPRAGSRGVRRRGASSTISAASSVASWPKAARRRSGTCSHRSSSGSARATSTRRQMRSS